jgi:hypothetical protein
MPIDYLTDEQEQRYARYVGEPTPEQLVRYFHLNDKVVPVVKSKREAIFRWVFTRLEEDVPLAIQSNRQHCCCCAI